MMIQTEKPVDGWGDFDAEGFPVRLRQIMEPDSIRSFGRLTRIGATTLQKYLLGQAVPGFDKAAQMAAARGVSLQWLATGNGPRHLRRINDAGQLPAGFVAVPYIDIRPSAGPGTLAVIDDQEPEIAAFREEWLRRIGVSPRHARLMIAKGDSMYDTICDGDLMIVDVSIREIVHEGIYVLVYGGLVLLKRIQMMRNGNLLLKSDNPRYEPEQVPPDEWPNLIVEGRVRWSGGPI